MLPSQPLARSQPDSVDDSTPMFSATIAAAFCATCLPHNVHNSLHSPSTDLAPSWPQHFFLASVQGPSFVSVLSGERNFWRICFAQASHFSAHSPSSTFTPAGFTHSFLALPHGHILWPSVAVPSPNTAVPASLTLADSIAEPGPKPTANSTPNSVARAASHAALTVALLRSFWSLQARQSSSQSPSLLTSPLAEVQRALACLHGHPRGSRAPAPLGKTRCSGTGHTMEWPGCSPWCSWWCSLSGTPRPHGWCSRRCSWWCSSSWSWWCSW
mmetsp:Transcript_14458/g.38695  ORF Transcript_14458/g.38695 Transcript_14458/m.38695 type:complete len:271 (+) Transcript_14458:494-1306(+)